MNRRWGLYALALGISGCGSDKTITAQFSATRQPELIVTVSMSASGATSEDVSFTDNPNSSIGGNPAALLACAKYLGWIRADVASGGLSGLTSCNGTSASTSLAGYFASVLSPSISVPSAAYSDSAFTLKSKSSGFVFFVSFYDLNSSVGNRCFQITAAEISDGQFLLDTGARTSTMSFQVTDTAYPATGDVPGTDRVKCFRF